MTSLKKLQEDFIEAVRAESAEGISSEIAEGKISRAGMIGIYSNNLYQGRSRTLANIYPAVMKLVGEKFFAACARGYIKENPPESGNLDDYGESFAEFIYNFSPAAQLPYLADVAWFEWLYHQCRISEEKILNVDTLSNISPEEFVEVKFRLNPSAQFFHSKFPALKIWQMTKEENPPEFDISREQPDNLLMLRKGNEICFLSLTPLEKEFILLLGRGEKLDDALEEIEKKDAEFDLAFYINKHIESGTFCEVI